ncbi:MAG: urate hydroxylase PuuD [Myxococcota bacterium]
MEIFGIDGWFFLLRWLHFLAGITWIGVLYYFNFIQTPFFGTDLGGQARGLMVRGLVPNALWWFRWGAMFTFLTGWAIVLLKMHQAGGITPNEGYLTLILTGGTMGTIMWANVWFVIWPAQKLAIASAEAVAGGGEANPEAAARAPLAARASRTNTLFSFPMLFFMGAASHFPQMLSGSPSYAQYWLGMLILVALVELNALAPKLPTHKPLSSVSGTIHAGLGLTVVLYILAQVTL